MTCPDPVALTRANPPAADPEVVDHLKSCPSCWLDWQIQQGARYALDPEAEVPPGLNERAIARIERKARELEEETRWWDLPILGTLVAIAAFAFFVAGGSAETAMPPGSAVIGAVVSGIVAALYTWYQDRKEYREVLRTA
ncbi:MAG: hypothetical protein OXQ94_16330 [Gemmatimonadota bacterium]|nr:hypothetical protein [Gemmatimonadota bacterium]MDE2873246.1 hypothetical protein [Gemmatimonadota bacterium]